MEWSEAAMLPAIVRTLGKGAALGQLKRLNGYETAILADTPAPARQMTRNGGARCC